MDGPFATALPYPSPRIRLSSVCSALRLAVQEKSVKVAFVPEAVAYLEVDQGAERELPAGKAVPRVAVMD